MGILFISHSSQDSERAVDVRNWLKSNGWGQVFLDLDPHQGMTPGRIWQDELKQAGERCSAVLLLLSPGWVAARWCQTEYLVADQLGKKIFPILIAPTPFDDLPPELRAKYHILDISTAEKNVEGLERLGAGLRRAGLAPDSFPWPPPSEPLRPIYRGLESLDEQDAAIFFGRDAPITQALDALRRTRDGGRERALVILGASGAGKSSFLKAGLIARLNRDQENFVVVPVVRPERAALSGEHGLAASLGCTAAALTQEAELATTIARCRAPAIDRLRRFAERGGESYAARPPTIVLPIDQAEELFSAENVEALPALEVLARIVRTDPNTIIIATIRTDAFARIQESQELSEIGILPFSLAAMPHASFKDVIEGPARLAHPPLLVERELLERLLQDLATDDALPLLGFTLERLNARARGRRTLTLADYAHEMGGLQGAIQAAVDEAFARARRDDALPKDHAALEKLARAAFIPHLVQVDDADGEPKRRVERFDALPESTRPLIRHLVDARLLIKDRRMLAGKETDTVEVAHEAILRQWPALRSWIAEERDALRALDGVRMAAREWKLHVSDGNPGKGWLAHGGGRLEETEQLLAPVHFAGSLGPMECEYLAACRAHESAERDRERGEIVREKRAIAHTKRLQRNISLLIGAAVALILIGGFGLAELLKGIGTRSSDALASLAEQASANQDYERAARYALAGLAGADWPLVGYSGARAERALRTASALSPRIAVLRGHGGPVYDAAWNPEGTRIVTGLSDGTARIWDARTGRSIAILRGHKGTVTGVAWSPDGTRIATASIDKTARLWDARTFAQLVVLRGHGDIVENAAWSADSRRIVTASDDKTARIWDARTGAQIAVLRGHEAAVENAAWSPDSRRIATSSDDKTARIWDAGTGAQIGLLKGHDDIVYSAVWNPDGTRILTASAEETARIWDAQTNRQVGVLPANGGIVTSASWNARGTQILTASADKTARIWDAHSLSQIAVFRGHENFLTSASWSPDGTRILTTSLDGTARVWDAGSDASIVTFRGHQAAVENVAWCPDSDHIVTASRDGTARVWDVQHATQTAILRGHDGPLLSAAVNPDGTQIVTTSLDRTTRIWNARTGVQLAILRGLRADPASAAWNTNGTQIITTSGDGTAWIWDARNRKRIAILRGHEGTVYSGEWSPDGSRIVTTSVDKTARVWDARRFVQLSVLRGQEGTVYSAAWSPDGTRLVTASGDGTAWIWDARAYAPIGVLHGHGGPVYTAQWSPDANQILTSSDDHTARIWNARTGVQIAILRGHDGAVYGAAWSPDGKRIVTASRDGTAQVWKVTPADTSLAFPARSALIATTCAVVLADGLDHLSNEELSVAPNLDPQIDADACHPPSIWARLEKLVFAAPSR